MTSEAESSVQENPSSKEELVGEIEGLVSWFFGDQKTFLQKKSEIEKSLTVPLDIGRIWPERPIVASNLDTFAQEDIEVDLAFQPPKEEVSRRGSIRNEKEGNKTSWLLLDKVKNSTRWAERTNQQHKMDLFSLS